MSDGRRERRLPGMPGKAEEGDRAEPWRLTTTQSRRPGSGAQQVAHSCVPLMNPYNSGEEQQR
jgi:hypothetical protein